MDYVAELDRQMRRIQCPAWSVEGPYGGSWAVRVHGLNQVNRMWLSDTGIVTFEAGDWEHVVPVAELGRYLKRRPETKPFVRRVLIKLFG